MDEEWVQILVPKSRVREIYRLVAGVSATPMEGEEDGVLAQLEHGEDRTAETVRRVYRESQPPLQRFFDLLADHPDEWVTTDQVLAATGLSPRQWPQQLSSLARRGKKRYLEAGRWPFRSEKLYEPSSKRQVWRYSMPREYAEIVRAMRG